MRVLLVTLGSHGDVHPFIAIARALIRRGHSATILTNEYFKAQIERSGVAFLPVGERVDLAEMLRTSNAMHPMIGPLVILNQLVIPSAEPVYHATLGAIKDHHFDAVLVHPICLSATWACERARVPWVSVCLSPSLWFNPADSIVMVPTRSHSPRRSAVRLDLMVGKVLMRALLDRPLNRVRRGLGLRARRVQFSSAARGEGALFGAAMWSPAFRPLLPGDPEDGVIAGFPFFDAHHDEESASTPVETFLQSGEAPIVFSLGTAAVHRPGKFFHSAVRACEMLGRRGVLLIGKGEYARNLPVLPPGIAAFEYAPFSAIVPRAAAFVHHGGIGSTAQGLRAGKPTVITPLAHDQYDNAARAKRLGVSETVRHGRASAGRLAAALRSVLEQSATAERANEIGAVIRAEKDGADVVVERLENEG